MAETMDLIRRSRLDAQINEPITKHVYHRVDSLRRTISEEESWRKAGMLGRGGSGEVYLEECLTGSKRGELRAVKRLYRCDTDVNRELSAIALFSDPKYEHCFVQSSGWFEVGSEIYIAMEYLQNGHLGKCFSSALPEDQVQAIIAQTLEGVNHMHDYQLAHRDLKPENILVVRPGPLWWVKLADFGISKRVGEGQGSLRTQVGTTSFVAPEVLLASLEAPYTIAVDLWAVGIITFLLLTGQTIFTSDRTVLEYADGRITLPLDLLGHKSVSAYGCDFVRNLLQADPEKRHTARAARDDPWLQAFHDRSRSNGQADEAYRPPSTDSTWTGGGSLVGCNTPTMASNRWSIGETWTSIDASDAGGNTERFQSTQKHDMESIHVAEGLHEKVDIAEPIRPPILPPRRPTTVFSQTERQAVEELPKLPPRRSTAFTSQSEDYQIVEKPCSTTPTSDDDRTQVDAWQDSRTNTLSSSALHAPRHLPQGPATFCRDQRITSSKVSVPSSRRPPMNVQRDTAPATYKPDLQQSYTSLQKPKAPRLPQRRLLPPPALTSTRERAGTSQFASLEGPTRATRSIADEAVLVIRSNSDAAQAASFPSTKVGNLTKSPINASETQPWQWQQSKRFEGGQGHTKVAFSSSGRWTLIHHLNDVGDDVVFSPDENSLAWCEAKPTGRPEVRTWTVSRRQFSHAFPFDTVLKEEALNSVRKRFDTVLGEGTLNRARTVRTTPSRLSFDYSPDGLLLAAVSKTGSMCIWNATTGKSHCAAQPDNSQLSTWANAAWGGDKHVASPVKFSRSGRLVACGGPDYDIVIRSTDTGRICHRLSGQHNDAILDLQFSFDERHLLSRDRGSHIKAWHITSKEVRGRWTNDKAEFAARIDGQSLVLMSDDGNRNCILAIYSADTGVCRQRFMVHESRGIRLCQASEGRIIGTSANDETVKLWDGETGELLQCIDGGDGGVISNLVLSTDGNFLAIVRADNSITIVSRTSF